MYHKTIFLVIIIDATLAYYYIIRSRKNLLERIQKLIMTTGDKIRDEKLHYDINREAANYSIISALSSSKIDKYEYLTAEEILPPDQRRVIEQAKFAYSKYCIFFLKNTQKRLNSKEKTNRCYYRSEQKKARGFNQQR